MMQILRVSVLSAVFATLLFNFQNVEALSSKDSIPSIEQIQMVKNPDIYVFGPTDPRHASEPSSLTKKSLSKRSFHQKKELHQVLPGDTFQMSLSAYNQTFSLILEPNYDLLHPDAKVRLRQKDGTFKIVPLQQNDVHVYRGYVTSPSGGQDVNANRLLSAFHGGDSDISFNPYGSGARITFFKDKETGLVGMDGNFFYQGETYNLKHVDFYDKNKGPDDPHRFSRRSLPDDLKLSKTVIYRRSDTFIIEKQNNYKRLGTRSTEKSTGSGFSNTCASHRLQHGNTTREYIEQFEEKEELYRVEYEPWWKRTPKSLKFTKRADDTSCLGSKKVLYMGVAADCTYIANYGSEDKARTQILSNWNQASSVYERQLGIQLGVVDMQMETMSCPSTLDSSAAWNRDCSDTYSIEDRLNDFSAWRGKRSDDSLGLWHLMTQCASGPEVGLAWTSVLCQTESLQQRNGVVSGTGVSAINLDEWKVVAHEIGHNFGAIHDCTKGTCGSGGGRDCCQCSKQCDCDGKYIMNPTNPVSTDDFSPCSINAICTGAKNGLQCLSDPGSRTVLSKAMCGNGIKEGDEECDCGTSDACKNDPCCDQKTCKFKNGAKCSDYNDLCCSNCQIRSKGTVCRQKNSDCDVEEVCDGQTGDCPADDHVDDGTSCGSGKQCASGQCTNRDAQCKARGGNMGITQHCPLNMMADPCKFQCKDPNSSNACIFMSGSFLDGTECGWHSKCRSGKCKGDNAFYQFANLYRNNLAVAIPVTIIVIIVIVIIISTLLHCFCGCCRSFSLAAFTKHGRRAKVTRAGVTPVPPHGYAVPQNMGGYAPQGNGGFAHLSSIPDIPASGPQQPYQYPPPQYPGANPHYAPPQSGWVDPGPYNGNINGGHPPRGYN
ncbi:hypothetical protein H4219_000147 [Mycoemilia scoparia]|uniref:Disintegrin and metalloproteinase domain-containing protein B n=1 Tax=Mycoemilia scoparia TaxID=417184 RepID=A0A9W8DXE3_9FUNG|nr:hypothetical protein H4219_000147 [Mycoemilia scoparia]